jgi:hypothetical protein
MIGIWVVIDREGYTWDCNFEDGTDWTASEAIRQTHFAQQAGGSFTAVLLAYHHNRSYFLEDGQVWAVPLDGSRKPDWAGRFISTEAHAMADGINLGELREMFAL